MLRSSFHIVLSVLLTALAACNDGSDRPRPNPSGPSSQAENTDAACSDDKDNDGDSFTDCDDPDCTLSATVTVCIAVSENTPAACKDGEDNDRDGLVDCADPECESAGCKEDSDEFCSDGEDNDGDGFADCDDFDCKYGCMVTVCNSGPSERTEAECSDNVDNDGDGFSDCVDFGCRDCVESCRAGLGENSVALCTDGLDNDNDGKIDCRDDECVRREGVTGCDTGEENTEAACSDGVDNDNDPWVDCADRNCQGLGDCVEDTVAKCTDGLDNDGDRYVDCQDFDCGDVEACQEGTDELCSDGLDNEGDGYIDCDDANCKYGCNVTVCPGAEKSAAQCSDGTDNDGDNKVDCADRGCRECVTACQTGLGENTVALCTDGQDNDSDGNADCRDDECFGLDGVTGCDTGEENTPSACSDGVDNDNDPWIDCADRSCRGVGPCVENDDAKCADGLDNDGDGRFDCDDYDCSRNSSVTVCATSPEDTNVLCGDGQDNDSDGKLDCDDTDCWASSVVSVCSNVVSTTIARIQDRSRADAVVIPSGQTRVKVKLTCVSATSSVLTNRAGRHVFFVQEAFPPADTKFSGIEVFAGNTLPKLNDGQDIVAGARLNLFGNYTEHFGLSQITFTSAEPASSGDCGASGVPAIVPTSLLTQDLLDPTVAESYEGVLVKLPEVRVTAVGVQSSGGSDPQADDFTVLEASAAANLTPLVVSTQYETTARAVGDRFGYLVGALTFAWDVFRLAPRAASDFGPADTGPVDADGDGLSDAEEQLLGTNPLVADTDGDSKGDLVEIIDVTAPRDTDCDGKLDAVESSTLDSDGDGTNDEEDWDDDDGPAADPDHDGTPNSLDSNDDGDDFCDPGFGPISGDCSQVGDNCPTRANADQANQDGDALGDACDPDIDGDGVCNRGVCQTHTGQCDVLDDNCTSVANDDQVDSNGDGEGDACDPDDDGDGICDAGQSAPGVCALPGGAGDNCRLVINPDQGDNDSDGLGDACDADDDNDGVCDPGLQEGTDGCTYVAGAADNCPLVYNPQQEDADSDGAGDACEVVQSAPLAGEIVINEILADPYEAPGKGDANGDGTVSSTQDEFVELVNNSGKALDLAGCELRDATGLRHAFEPTADPAAYVMAHASALVVFAGGSPTGTFGGAKVLVSSTGLLGLNNAGDTVTLLCPGDSAMVQVAQVIYGSEADQNQSIVRSSDGDSAALMVKHKDITGSTGAPYSPGTCTSGAPFPTCLPQ